MAIDRQPGLLRGASPIVLATLIAAIPVATEAPDGPSFSSSAGLTRPNGAAVPGAFQELPGAPTEAELDTGLAVHHSGVLDDGLPDGQVVWFIINEEMEILETGIGAKAGLFERVRALHADITSDYSFNVNHMTVTGFQIPILWMIPKPSPMLRQILSVLKRLVLQPEDVEVELVPLRQLIVLERPPASIFVLLAPGLHTIVPHARPSPFVGIMPLLYLAPDELPPAVESAIGKRLLEEGVIFRDRVISGETGVVRRPSAAKGDEPGEERRHPAIWTSPRIQPFPVAAASKRSTLKRVA